MRLVALRDLTRPDRDALGRRLHAMVLTPSFPLTAELEEVSILLARLNGNPPPPEPQTHIIAALDENDAPVGGVVGEFYRTARAGLVTYIAITPSQWRTGLARRLLDRMLATLANDAGPEGAPVFAETEDPELAPSPAHVGMDLVARLMALDALGFAATTLPYVQPSLGAGKPPVRWLRFLVHRASLPPGATSVPSERLRSFLNEFYEALGSDPATDPDFLAMAAWLDRQPKVALKSLAPPSSGGPSP